MEKQTPLASGFQGVEDGGTWDLAETTATCFSQTESRMWYPVDAMALRSGVGFGRESMEPSVATQLHSSSGRSSKLLKDRARIDTVVEVAGAGTLVLAVDGAGGHSLRAYPEGGGDAGRDLLAVGMVRADGIVVVRPEASPASDAAQLAPVQRP